MAGGTAKSRTMLLHPVTLSVVTMAVAAGLYALEGQASQMAFVCAVIATIAAATWCVTRKPAFAVYLGLGLVAVTSAASVIKYRLRGFDLHVYDFLFTGADLDAIGFLVSGYPRLVLPAAAALALGIAALGLIAWLEPRGCTRLSTRVGAFALTVAMLPLTYPLAPDQPRYFYYLGGYNASSFYVSFLDLPELFTSSKLADRLRTTPRNERLTDTVQCPPHHARPDVFMILSESQTNPELFPALRNRAAFADNFVSDDGRQRTLNVEVFGGGTWISNLSVMTGLSSIDFGWESPYLTVRLEGRIKGALPELMARCGYRTVAILPLGYRFVNEGPFLESIGFETVLDRDAIGAPGHAERDSFYFAAAEKVLAEQHETDGRPLFLFLETMFTHSPYDERLAAQTEEAEGGFSEDAEADEYLRRMLLSRRDFSAFLSAREIDPGPRGAIVLDYGDHQSAATRPYVFAQDGSDALGRLDSLAYRTYYTVHAYGTPLDMRPFEQPSLDIGYLGASLLQAGGLPTSPTFVQLAKLRDHCGGRYHTCPDRALVDGHLKSRLEAGLLKLD